MTVFLVATDSVHTSAAAADYLAGRADGNDVIYGVFVDDAGDATTTRDGMEALNAFRVRLAATTTVETAQRDGDVVAELCAHADEKGIDEFVIGARSGAPGGDRRVGATARELLGTADRPVVVVPLEALE